MRHSSECSEGRFCSRHFLSLPSFPRYTFPLTKSCHGTRHGKQGETSRLAGPVDPVSYQADKWTNRPCSVCMASTFPVSIRLCHRMSQTHLQTVVNGGIQADDTDRLIAELDGTHTLPLWTQMAKLNPHEPDPRTVPHIWRYDEIRPYLLRAGDLVTEKQAERRVLMLINPARGRIRPHIPAQRLMLTQEQKHRTPRTLFMLDFSLLCQMRRPLLIGMLLSPCVSSSKVKADSLPCMVVESECNGVMLY